MASLAGFSSGALVFLVFVIGILVVVGLVVMFAWLYTRWKRYNQFSCIVWEKDGFGQLTQTNDKAGIFVDWKTKNKRLFLKRFNVGLDPDRIPYLPTQGGRKVIYLLKTGLKNFHYINPIIAMPKITLQVGEEDVNWAINAYERSKTQFLQNLFLQYLPFMALAFVSIIILIVFIYFFKDFSVLRDVAEGLNQAAQAIAQAQAGTVIVQ